MTIDYVLREQFDALKVEVAALRAEVAALQGRAVATPKPPLPDPPVRGQVETEQVIRDVRAGRT